MSDRAAPITNLRYYKNETKTGNRSATPARQGLHYYTFGRDEKIGRLDEEHNLNVSARGQWHDPEGSVVNVPNMTKWIKDQSAENKYTYTAVLSLRDGDMKIEDFVQAMNKQTQFADFRLILHTDTGHDHAHVMMMRDKTLTKSDFNKWRRDVGRELGKREIQRLEEKREREEQAAIDKSKIEPKLNAEYELLEAELTKNALELGRKLGKGRVIHIKKEPVIKRRRPVIERNMPSLELNLEISDDYGMGW